MWYYRHGALHCLGHEAISVGSAHVKIMHSGASRIVDAQSKYWQSVPENPGKQEQRHVDGFCVCP